MKHEADKKTQDELLDFARRYWQLNHPELYNYTAKHHHELGYEEAIAEIKSIDFERMPKPSQFLTKEGLFDTEAYDEEFDKWAQKQITKV